MRLALFAAFALAGSSPAFAQAPMSADPLAYFSGAWRCDGVFPSNGKTLASTIRFETDVASGALLKHHDDIAPGAYHALETWSFKKAGGFSDTIVDHYNGARAFTSPGWAGDTLTWSSVAEPHPERFAYTRLSPTQMRVDWSISKDGAKYILGDTLTCNRT